MKILKVLLSVVQSYESEHKERYKNLDDKTKASELILLFEILVNTLDKKARPVNLSTGLSFSLILLFKIFIEKKNLMVFFCQLTEFSLDSLKLFKKKYVHINEEKKMILAGG